MHTIVLGSGVIGTCTAYYLARAGVKVTVIDRQAGPALETSFANAGQVSPGYSTPWAAPGIPLKAMKWLFQRHAPLAVQPDGTLFQWQWLLQMLANCTPDRYAVNKARMVRLAEYSRDCLRALREDLRLHYDEGTGGTLQVFRTQQQLDAAARDVAVLREQGVAFELLSREQLPTAEPALAAVLHRLAGGLRLPGDETGDCYAFTQQLARQARQMGVDFRFGATLQGVRTGPQGVAGVCVDGQWLQADQYVFALGSYTRSVLKPLGLSLPVYPVKGYSLTVPLTVPLRDASAAPISTVLDETYKVAVTRLGNRLRVGGMAELAGFDLRLNPRRRETLELVVKDLFPQVATAAGALPDATFWTGLRPMTPDGTPIVGPTTLRNAWLNTGHGTLGWTMACGSGRLLADQICGRRPAIDTEGLSVHRYLRGGGARTAWVAAPATRA